VNSSLWPAGAALVLSSCPRARRSERGGSVTFICFQCHDSALTRQPALDRRQGRRNPTQNRTQRRTWSDACADCRRNAREG